MRLLFGVGRPLVENWNEVAWAMIQRLHREAWTAPERSSALLDELLKTPGLPRAFAVSEPGELAPPIVPLVLRRGDLRLALLSLIATFGTPLDVTLHELRIETFLPADDATERALRDLAR
jgi:hypothetical protein